MLTEAAARLDAFSFHDLEVDACWGSCPAGASCWLPGATSPGGPLRRAVLPATGLGDGDRLVVQYFHLARLTCSGGITRRAERL
jgi:hypothetical protein